MPAKLSCHIFAQLHAVWKCLYGNVCDSICLGLKKCMLFQIALYKRQGRVHQKAHCLPHRPFHLPGDIANPLNLCAPRSIQSKLPFVHKDATRRCMKNISGFIILSDISGTRPYSPLFLFFFVSHFRSDELWGWRTKWRKVVGRGNLAILQLRWERVEMG